MVNLIYKYNWSDDSCSGTAIIPFQYKSKSDFICDVLKRFDKKYFKKNSFATLFGEGLTKEVVDNIENDIYTLEEWFNVDTQRPFVL